MLGNLSTFDIVVLPSLPGQCERIVDQGYDANTVWLVGGVPTLCSIIMILILIKQNLDRVISLVTQIQICLSTMSFTRRPEATYDTVATTVVVDPNPPINPRGSVLAARDGESVRPLESVV